MTNSNKPREVTRRNFLSDVTIGATGAVALAALMRDEARAEALPPLAPAAEWDLTWVDRLTAKHRVVFDAPEINDGTVFTNATVFMMSFAEVYKATDADMQAVLVMRHNGVAAARRAREIARRVGADPETVRADIYANLVPGVIMQHSGVFATVRAQQAGCAFMKSG
jgi:hypothetical protein